MSEPIVYAIDTQGNTKIIEATEINPELTPGYLMVKCQNLQQQLATITKERDRLREILYDVRNTIEISGSIHKGSEAHVAIKQALSGEEG